MTGTLGGSVAGVEADDRGDVSSRLSPTVFMLGAGLVACVLAFAPVYLPGIARFDFPKAVVFHLAALGAAVTCASRARRLRLEWSDILFLAFLLWSAVASVGTANPWLALSALGLTATSLAVFFTARVCAHEGSSRHLGAFISAAIVVAAVGAVIEAHGLVRMLSVENGAPSGTLGNRNRMAHLLALGLPVFVFHAVTARRRASVLAMAAGLVFIAMALVLSRTRAAWLATMLVGAATVVGALAARAVVRRGVSPRRAALLAVAATLGVVAALYLPNRLVWSSASPYRDTLGHVVDYQSGSGRGRLLQYQNTLRMVRDHPLAGVGPGNWPVWYPRYAPPNDPTIHPTGVSPVYAFPHSDWLGVAAERGLPALAFLVLAGSLLLAGAWRVIHRSRDPDQTLRALATQGTLGMLGVIGLVDPVLLTPVASFLVCLTLGALATRRPPVISIPLEGKRRSLWVALVLVVLLAATADRGRRFGAVLLYASRFPEVGRLDRATRLYPGDYHAHMVLARKWAERGRCDLAGSHIEMGERLYPAALEPGRIRALCDRPPRMPAAPEVLSSKVVFAERCCQVIYSSNRDDRVGPYAIDLSTAKASVSPLSAPEDLDLFARSLSADCTVLALVGDDGGEGIFDVFLYEVAERKLRNLTATPRRNEGEAEFAPTGSLLVYLADGGLALYDARARVPLAVPESPAEFTAVAWSASGDGIFLEDRQTNIWRYDVARRSFHGLWSAPKRSYTPRMMHHHGNSLYFISDHESEFSQLYELDLASARLTRLHPAPHDQYSPKIGRRGELVFRTNIDGNFVAMRLRDGRAEAISPSRGVVYDLSLDFPDPLFVYAGERAITSVYVAERGDTTRLRSLVPLDFDLAQPRAREFRTSDGMVHLVYLADGNAKGWVVWLHGGPDEQVSPRFNLYFDFLVRLGHSVVAINYPGSTGIGNGYELRGLPDSVGIARQLEGIDEALAQVAKLHRGFERYVLVGVSYGSTLAFLHARNHPRQVMKVIDFSGVTEKTVQTSGRADCAGVSSLLSIQGANDRQERLPARRALLGACDRVASMRRVVLPDEGHYVRRMSSIRRILGEMERFLAASQ